ncbi:MAG: DUF4340 domain-containing protein [Victivallales bacterium]|nr:DUF4340 domain-containing protein [Victivallales bacterium]
MKTKQLFILIGIVVILGLIAILKNRKNNEDWRDSQSEKAATMLAEEFDTGSIYAVTIKDNDRSITMHRKDDGWKLADKYDYPANVQELMRFIVDLTETRIAQTLPLTQDQEKDTKLTQEAGAVTVTLADKAGNDLKTFVFGKKLEKETDASQLPPQMIMYGMGGNTPVGRYVSIDGNASIVANTFALVDEKTSNWFDSEFFKISDMKSATLSQNATPIWSVSRDTSSADLALVGDVPEGKEVDNSKLSAIKSAFSWIRFNDVAAPTAKPEEIGMDKAKVLTVIGFDGNVYTITFGAPVDGKQYLKVALTWNGATVRSPGADEKPEDKEKLDAEFATKIKDAQAKTKALNDRLSPWIYEVGTSSLSAVDKALNDLLKDKPKPEPTKKEDTPAQSTPPTPPAPPKP